MGFIMSFATRFAGEHKIKTADLRLGIIAGNRKFPQIFAREARRDGVRCLVTVAFEGETDPAIEPLVDCVEWLKLGQLQKLIEAFQKHAIRQVVMVGQIAPKNLFKNLRLDWRMAKLLAQLKRKNAETIFGAIGAELARNGIELVPHARFLRRIIPGSGVLTKRKPDKEEREDFQFGWNIARQIAALDIGQTVVVKRGMVLAVEAFEGTDVALRRGGELGQGGAEGVGNKGAGAVAVKATKPGQDMRFDIPCIGCDTIKTLKKAGISALGIEADKTLLLEKESLLEMANEAKIAIEALE